MKLFKLINFTKSYDLIWLAITPFVPLLIFYRIIIGKEEILRIKERFGYPSTTRNKKDKLIWLHAASLGEVASATSLAIGFKEANYKGLILITSGTKTSSEFTKNYKDIIHQYHPLDKKKWVNRFISFWKPDILIVMESDIWPNLILCSKNFGLPVVMASAQISNKSFTRMKNLGFSSTANLFNKVDLILATDKTQSEKFLQLGAKKVLTAKSLKISLPPQKTDQLYIENLKKGISNKIIILAASTREGEESILINSIQKLNKKNHNVFLIIAPRHIQRANKISKINNLNIKIKSKDGLPSSYDNFWISNTYGEMSNLYSLADIVFVGGSLYPFGGHNPSEPCHYKTKIIMGPHSEKCQDIVREMKDSNALIQLNSNSEDEIINSIEKIIINKDFSKSLSIAGSKLAKSWLKIKTNIAYKILKKFPLLVS